jgi:uncharacterized protein (TIGR02145 family)
MKTNAMFRVLAITLVISLIPILSCQKSENIEQPGPINYELQVKNTSDCSTSLIAGQTNIIGDVSVTFPDISSVTIVYTITESDWCLLETHLDVQVDPAIFPQTKSGNPKVGHFAYGEENLDCAYSWSVTVDLTTIENWAEGMIIYIAAHAAVSNGETAWGEGVSFPGNNWAMYFDCERPWKCGDLLIDERDGQEYNTVQIGEQCWMQENLNIGTKIFHNVAQTNNPVIEKYCYGNVSANCETYGGLYQWDEMMQYTNQEGAQGICPAGWHLPADAEWAALTSYVSSQPEYWCNSNSDIIAKALASTNLWTSSTYGCGVGNDLTANNSSGFTGLPGGILGLTSTTPPYPLYFYIHGWGYWWSSTENVDAAWSRGLYYDRAIVFRPSRQKVNALSVRCIRD